MLPPPIQFKAIKSDPLSTDWHLSQVRSDFAIEPISDGIEDGILQDPLACTFDPAALTCEAGTDTDECLTPKQVEAVEKIWAGAKDSAGRQIYPGLVPGGEAAPRGWSPWVTGTEPFTSAHWLAAQAFFRWFVFDDPDWDFRTFDFDRDLDYALKKVGSALDAVNPDLTALRDRGGKLIVYHGWSDSDISPVASINYYETVVDFLRNESVRMSREEGLAGTRDFFRLFMAPGMGHCRGGPGPDTFDALAALEDWVERGIAPRKIVASKMEGDEVVRTRPLCPYPEVSVYAGTGTTDDASNFSCAEP